MNTITAEDEIRQIEIDWGTAFERRDMVTLDRLMAEEYVVTDPLGTVRTKAESLAVILSNEVLFESTKSADVKVRVNGDTAIVTGRSSFRGRYRGFSVTGQYQYTDVLVKRQGYWLAVSSHITALAAVPLRLRVGRLLQILQIL